MLLLSPQLLLIKWISWLLHVATLWFTVPHSSFWWQPWSCLGLWISDHECFYTGKHLSVPLCLRERHACGGDIPKHGYMLRSRFRPHNYIPYSLRRREGIWTLETPTKVLSFQLTEFPHLVPMAIEIPWIARTHHLAPEDGITWLI